MAYARFWSRTARRAVILLYALVVMAALIFFASLFLDTWRGAQIWCRRAGDDLKARGAASAGIGDGLYQLSLDKTWHAGFDAVVQSSGATYSVSFVTQQTAIPYSTNNSGGTSAAAGEDGRVVPAGCVHLISVGSFGLATRRQEAIVNFSSGNMVLVSRWEH